MRRGPRWPQNDEDRQMCLNWRGIEEPCDRCHGSGVVTYSSTASWRGGIGGQMMTNDVCDKCWGSGDENNHWADLRQIRNNMQAEIAKGALSHIASSVGCELSTLHPAILAMCEVLKKEGRRRKPPTGDGWWDVFHWQNLCHCLEKTLREAIEKTKSLEAQTGRGQAP